MIAGKSLLGMPLAAEVTYERVREYLRAEDRPRLDETFASTLAEAGEHEVECAVNWPDGRVHWALFRSRAIRDAAGVPLRLMGVAMDVTHRRRAEEELRESEQFYRTLLETLPVTVVLADASGRVSYISPAAKQMFDLAPGEGLGTLPLDWIAPEHHESVRRRMRQVLVDLHPQPPIEYKMLKRDGTPIWAQVASAPILDREGRLKGVVTVCQDITERKRAEQALRENEARLRLAQQAAGAGTWDLDLLSGQVIVSEETLGSVGRPTAQAPPLLRLAGGRLSGGPHACRNQVPAGHAAAGRCALRVSASPGRMGRCDGIMPAGEPWPIPTVGRSA